MPTRQSSSSKGNLHKNKISPIFTILYKISFATFKGESSVSCSLRVVLEFEKAKILRRFQRWDFEEDHARAISINPHHLHCCIQGRMKGLCVKSHHCHWGKGSHRHQDLICYVSTTKVRFIFSSLLWFSCQNFLIGVGSSTGQRAAQTKYPSSHVPRFRETK